MDLNLIRIFTAVYEEGTVTAAAKRLHMSQPSVTQAINRLRSEAGDALFTRIGRGIAPTRSATQLYLEIGHLPGAAESAVRKLTLFDPTTTAETFSVALTDLGQTLFLPALAPALARVAPHSSLVAVNLDIDTASEELLAGRLDLAVASTLLTGDVRTSVLRHDVYCCVARAGRFTGEPGFDELSALPRIVTPNALGHQLLESHMAAPPPGSLHLPAFAAVPAIVAHSDLVAFVPRSIAQVWTPAWPLEEWPLPAEHFTSTVRGHTARQAMSNASAWFAQFAIETIRAIPSGSDAHPAVMG